MVITPRHTNTFSEDAFAFILDSEDFGANGHVYRGESNEYLSVWLSTTAPVPPNASLWSLKQDASGRPPIRMNGQYLRPLIHAGRTYVGSYEMEFTPPESGSASPGTPARETMTVIEFDHPQAREPIADLPPRTGETLCQFEMMQIK